MKNIVNEKSEILFLYEVNYSIPNGDPFTGEQRYDEESKKILVSDVRIKRFIRDYLQDVCKDKVDIYVTDKEKLSSGSRESGSASRLNALVDKYKDELKIKDIKKITHDQLLYLMRKCIDVRLFGGISTKEKAAVNLTGPVQFALLNPSLNRVDLRIHQNTSVFASSSDHTRGTIGTTSVVPFAICQIHGWVNPLTALHTGLTDNDLEIMFTALWESVNNTNTRSKSNHNSLLLLQFVYARVSDKIYGLDRLIGIKPQELAEEQIRSLEQANLRFDKLEEVLGSPKIKEMRYYTEHPQIELALGKIKNDKIKKKKLIKI
ncbi:MAG: type I-B CRISPR-associated protein Cas7/Csh2 [Methanobacteriota archaeon]|nr:MAG: type I-B CRISPR-associated protein Cas7/Csh2 [Euryarchaeota archaeon]